MRDVDAADALHALFAFLLFLEQLALSGDADAVNGCCHSTDQATVAERLPAGAPSTVLPLHTAAPEFFRRPGARGRECAPGRSRTPGLSWRARRGLRLRSDQS